MTPADLLQLLQSSLPPPFKVSRFLSGGGQGVVFEGEHAGAPAAVKIFNPDPERFAREVALLQAIQCPTLVKLLATTSVPVQGIACPVVAYELLRGGDLRKYIANGAAALPEKILLTIGCHVGRAIDALWAKRIVHRDIKPENILEDGARFVLVDVGVARHLDLKTITVLGGAPGTLGYKSPEQAAGRRALTKRSDIFALGVTLFELATRQHPFNRDQSRIGRVTPASLRTLRADLSPALTTLIDKMMAPDPVDRPLDAPAQLCALGGI